MTLEKLLKGCISEFTDAQPPKIDDLNKLTQMAGLEMPAEFASFVSELSQQSVATRYPEDLNEFTRADAKHNLEHTEKVMRWLEQILTSAA